MNVYVVLAVLVVLGIILVMMYNGLVRAKVRVDEAWSDITVQLKRRFDLIPNLIETVKAYAKHEQDTLQKVIDARNQAMSASGVGAVAKAENVLEGTLKNLFALGEAYPDLKANQNFLELQRDLVDSEDKIQAARRFFNAAVREFNSKLLTFPSNIFGRMLGFSPREFYEVENQAEIKEPVKVSF